MLFRIMIDLCILCYFHSCKRLFLVTINVAATSFSAVCLTLSYLYEGISLYSWFIVQLTAMLCTLCRAGSGTVCHTDISLLGFKLPWSA